MTTLIVGGAGYIGSHTAHNLRRHGHDAIIYDNLSTGHVALARGFELIVGDISDSSRLFPVLRRVDSVMHFAGHAYVGESAVNPRKYFRNNVQAGLSLLNACMDCGVQQFVFSSTCAVYGIPETIPIAENNPREPVNPYGVSKLFFENALEAYGTAYGLKFASLRYFNAAGADAGGNIGELHRPETHLIPCALLAARGASAPLEIFGTDYPTPDGTCVRDYIHVSDLAEAHVLALQHLSRKGVSAALNLGTGQGYSVLEILDKVREITGHSVPFRTAPRRPGDPPNLVARPGNAARLLGWKPTRTLDDIIRSAWNWMQRNQDSSAAA